MSTVDIDQIFHPEPLILVISGPSGAGKDSVLRSLKSHNLPLHFVITVNTREPRDDEKDGIDYFFISKEKFFDMVEKDELLEHTRVYDDYKGIPKDQIREALSTGKDVILRIDVQGAATIRALCPQAVLIFLLPATEAELVQRLAGRNSDSPESLKIRMETAHQEIARLNEFDYVVLNPQNQLEKAVEDIISIINAEHHRVLQRKACL